MVTIPTIDQISGTTVMNKMRSLIHAFINFATGIDDEITEFENTVTQDFYTKLEIDTKFSDYYTKSEITTMLSSYFTKTEINTMLGDYYTKLQIDSTLADYYTDSEVDTLLEAKQDVLTAGTNITIENNVISATGGGSDPEPTSYLDNITGGFQAVGLINSSAIALKDFCVEIVVKAYAERAIFQRFIFKKGERIFKYTRNEMGTYLTFVIPAPSSYSGYENTVKVGVPWQYGNNPSCKINAYSVTSYGTYYKIEIGDKVGSCSYLKDFTYNMMTVDNTARFRVGVYE